jgi:hypothetical protein
MQLPRLPETETYPRSEDPTWPVCRKLVGCPRVPETETYPRRSMSIKAGKIKRKLGRGERCLTKHKHMSP